MKTLSGTALLIIFAFTACAPVPQSYQPVIDTGAANYSHAQYCRDLYECREYAKQISPGNQAIGEGLAGAAFGAALGAILGTGYNDVGGGAATGAGAIGLAGAAHGAGSAVGKQKRIINNCMRGRGYQVLN